MNDLSQFFVRKIQFTYSLVAMFIFLSIVLSLSYSADSYVFALSFVFFFILGDVLERGMDHKRYPIALSSLTLTIGIYLFLIGLSGQIHFHLEAVFNLLLFYFTLILAVTYRITHRNAFFGIRTSFTLSSEKAWFITHEVASKLLFFSLFFYLFVLATSDHPLFHLCYFFFNLIINALSSLWLAKQFLSNHSV